MNYEIKQEEKRTVAGFHLVGPWEQTVKKGFEQLMMWVDSKNIVPKEWVAVYYDNPDETPAEKKITLRHRRDGAGLLYASRKQ